MKTKEQYQKMVQQGYPHKAIREIYSDLEKELNMFYKKYVLFPNAPPNSKRFICHDHTEELAKTIGITLKEKKPTKKELFKTRIKHFIAGITLVTLFSLAANYLIS